MKYLISAVLMLISLIGFGQNLVQEVTPVEELRHVTVKGFDIVEFQYADEMEITISYYQCSNCSGSTAINRHIDNDVASVSLKQRIPGLKKANMKSSVVVSGPLKQIKTVKVSNGDTIKFPKGFDESNLQNIDVKGGIRFERNCKPKQE